MPSQSYQDGYAKRYFEKQKKLNHMNQEQMYFDGIGAAADAEAQNNINAIAEQNHAHEISARGAIGKGSMIYQDLSSDLILDQHMDQALESANITDQIIKGLRDSYLPLKVDDPQDNRAYKLVKQARLHCKNLRVMAEKICKAGRADAKRISDAWIRKEKEIISQISVVEDHLEAQEKWVEQERARIAREEEEKRKQLEREKLERAEYRQRELAAYHHSVSITGLLDMSEDEYAAFLAEAQRLDFKVTEFRKWQPDITLDEIITWSEGEYDHHLSRVIAEHDFRVKQEQALREAEEAEKQRQAEERVKMQEELRKAKEEARIAQEEKDQELAKLREALRISEEAKAKAEAELKSKDIELMEVIMDGAKLKEDEILGGEISEIFPDSILPDTVPADPFPKGDPLKRISIEAGDGSYAAQLAWAALTILTTQLYKDKNPYEVIEILELAWDKSKWPEAKTAIYEQQ
jgi:hypothetical protein